MVRLSSDRITVLHSDRDLYEMHSREVTRFAASLVGPSDASDVVHDAMAALIASAALAGADNPRALMYRAVLARAKTVQRSAFRRRGRERRYAENVVSADPEVIPEVARAVAHLSPQQRACIFLTYWEDLTPSQVGERLSIAEGTVKLHLARARQNLREVLYD